MSRGIEQDLGPERARILSGADGPLRVVGGGGEVYAELLGSGGRVAGRRFLFGVDVGEALFPLPQSPDLRVVVVGQRAAEIEALASPEALGPEARVLAEGWLEKVLGALASFEPPPRGLDQTLAPGGRSELSGGERVTGSDWVLWVRVEKGEVGLFDHPVAEAPGLEVVPLNDRLWLRAAGPSALRVLPRDEVESGAAWLGWLHSFHAAAVEALVNGLLREHRSEEERLAAKASLLGDARQRMLQRFSRVIDDPAGEDGGAGLPPLVAVCRRIGEALGAEIDLPHGVRRGATVTEQIETISRRSRLRARQVVLRDGWWRRESRPMLAFWRDTGRPAAVLPGRRGPRLWEPAGDAGGPRVQPITRELAAAIDPVAFSFYRILPDRRLKAWDVLRFALAECRRDLALAVVYAGLVMAMSALVPVATGTMIDVTIPSHQRSQLLLIALGLGIAAGAAFSFRVAQDIAVLRVQGKMAEALQPAILDRLLRQPNRFFRQHTAGDLAERVKAVETLESRLAEGALPTVLAGLLSAGNFLLLIWLEPTTALVACGLLVFLLLVFAVFAGRQQRFWLAIQQIEGRLATLVLEMIAGVHRIRLAGAEDRMFVRWGKLSMKFRDVLTRCYDAEVAFHTFLRIYGLLALAVIFGLLGRSESELSTGGFLAFVAAFTLVLQGFSEMAGTLLQSTELVPMVRRMRPLLESVPESDLDKTHPGTLSGHLEVAEVGFRYDDDLPEVLQGVTFEVQPGESVAIVGPSGCGKSTLLRLILGFERPTSGSIYFDGKDLAGLDLREVRHQIGVVLQHDELMEATLYENIRGDNEVSVEEAWRAARMCGIEKDIRAMPLGMFTVVSAQGSELSGGQVQRLLIARALAAHPRILLLDEATSALDNKTQSIVTESLDRLRVTRLAIAHRLSTVKNADRILVMVGGKIVESGEYEELMAAGGAFAALVRRQLHS